MDQDWSDWADDGDYHGDAAETADLGDPDEPLASGAYGDPDGDYPADPGEHGEHGEHGDPAPGPAGQTDGGFLDDDPMGAFDTDSFGDGDGADDGADDGAEPLGYEEPDTSTDAAGDPESVVGADPDVDPDADWSPADFPAQLDFAAPEPVDGYPWSDASAVAAPGTGGDDPSAGPDGAPPAQDLLDYAGTEGGTDPWSALVGSDDPATSSLGRWWSPDA